MDSVLLLNIQPGYMLVIGFIFLSILLLAFWPQKGVFARISMFSAMNERALLEDALKYLFDCGYKSISCDVDSIAGRLHISVVKATKLVDRLNAMGLVYMRDQNISLTDTGRSYSLRIIRVHRIWERYLADETSVAQVDWHHEADLQEHSVTNERIEKLAAKLGNPVYDPHGDPIPTAKGELPTPRGKPLNCMEEGTIARITHIEDEPQNIYEQLVVLGLYPGMQIYVADVDKRKISFVANGEECTLTPIFAAQITVEELPGDSKPLPRHELLSSLNIGEEAEIIGISPICRGQQRRRLMDMGIVPGSAISAEIKSASGDPVGYNVMGTTIGIRRKQADLIFIHKKNEQVA